MALTRDQRISLDLDEPRTFADIYKAEALASRTKLGDLYRERTELRDEIDSLKHDLQRCRRQLVAAGFRRSPANRNDRGPSPWDMGDR